MSKARRNFDADFKLNICKSIREQGLTITQICRDNDLGQTTENCCCINHALLIEFDI